MFDVIAHPETLEVQGDCVVLNIQFLCVLPVLPGSERLLHNTILISRD